MNIYSKKEGFKIGLNQLVNSIEQWDVPKRINEKIEIWGIRFTTKKIKTLPTKFLSTAILYYFVNRLSSAIRGYTQDMLMNVSFQLKSIYNSLSLTLFKKSSFFDFTIIILAKLTQYFLTSRFSEYITRKEEIQSDLYQSIVKLLIGYEVDSKAYEIMLSKERQKEGYTEHRNSSQLVKDVKFSPELMEKFNQTTKKLHRIGLQNLFQNNQEKSFQTFRMEVREALHIRKKTQPNNQSKEGQRHKENILESSTKGESGWTKGKNKLMNVNQVSAAMSIHQGIDLHNKTSTNIHLSKRRQLKEYYVSVLKTICQPVRTSVPISETVVSSPKNKDWSSIVSNLKQHSQHISMKDHGQTMKNYQFLTKNQSTTAIKPLRQEHGIDDDNDYTVQDNVDFRRLKNGEDESIHIKEELNKPKGEKPPRKSSSLFFVRDRGQFQKTCMKRRQQFENHSIYLPKLQRP